MKIKIPLVPGWRKLWRALSVQIPALNLAMLSTWAALPDDLKAVIPASWLVGAAAALIVLGIAGRLVDQRIEPALRQGDKPLAQKEPE